MSKKKSPNAALIEALTPAKPIPYDPELMQAFADADRREWQKLEKLRREVYRIIMPNVWVEVLEAERTGDADLVKSIQIRADQQWRDAMAVPALTSWSNLEIIFATVEAAGYPATDAGLHAWTIARVPVDKPMWNGRTLSFRGKVAREVKGQATNVRRVLDEFQQAGWPTLLEDPLPGGKDGTRLSDTIKSLNQGLQGLIFRGGGNAESYVWEAK